MDGLECSAFDRKDLPVNDGMLGLAGSMLVYGRGDGRVQAQQVGNTTSVVTMPVSE